MSQKKSGQDALKAEGQQLLNIGGNAKKKWLACAKAVGIPRSGHGEADQDEFIAHLPQDLSEAVRFPPSSTFNSGRSAPTRRLPSFSR